MKAAYYEQMGPAPDVLKFTDIPLPEPSAGEVRVKILWSGINPSDCKSRVGLRNKNMPYPRVIPHSDGMGIVDALGAGVTSHHIGQRVWLWNAARGRAHGTASEYLSIPAQQAVQLPDNVPDEVGACLGVPGLTAMHAVLMDGGVKNKTVLITGGAGAVGHYAIQMAVQLGAARVITTVSTPDKATLAKSAGANDIIFYQTESVPKRVSEITGGVGVDRIIELDIAANGANDAEMLRAGGDCIVYGTSATPFELPFYPLISKNLQLKFFIVYELAPQDRNKAIQTLNTLLKENRLIHHIAARYSFDQIVQAHEFMENGKAVGKVLLNIASNAKLDLN